MSDSFEISGPKILATSWKLHAKETLTDSVGYLSKASYNGESRCHLVLPIAYNTPGK